MLSTPEISKRKKWAIICGLSMGTSVIFMDSTILPVALPTIQREFEISQVGLQWVINSYLLVMACLMLVGGKLSDLFGHRRVFCLGMSAFGFFSIIGGFSHHEMVLILSRSFQGVGSAIMIPSSVAILAEMFSEKERGRSVGILVAISSIFLSLGPFIGGFLTEYVSWRFVFWVNIPIVVLGIMIILACVPKSETFKESFDMPGCLVFIAAFFFLILALMQAREWGWGSIGVISLFVLSFIFTIVLVILLKKAKYPFIDYHLFKNSIFMGGNLIIFCSQFLMTMTVYWAIYFQKTIGYTPVEAGILSLTSTLPLLIGAPLSGYLSDHYGPKVSVMIGFLLTSSAFIIFALLGMHPELRHLILSLLLFGFGISIIMTPVANATINAVFSTKRGVATGIYSTIRNASGPFGVAILGNIITNISFSHCEKILKEEKSFQGVDIQHYIQMIADGRPLISSVESLSSEKIKLLQEAFVIASNKAFFWANLLCFFVSLLGLFFCFIYFWKAKKHKTPASI